MPLDQFSRPLRELRVSVTDHCNFRCGYCMPREVFGAGYAFMPRAELLSFEEIERLVRIFMRLGVQKVRLTGGEPLLRRDLANLVSRLAALGLDDLALTTNGSLLAAQAADLHQAGLKRITVSLDALDPVTFQRMADSGVSVETVEKGIFAAGDAGFEPIKVNMVVRRGWNDHFIGEMRQRFNNRKTSIRFIEYMDVGNVNGWRAEEVVTADEILAELTKVAPLVPMPPRHVGEVARRYQDPTTGAEIGVVASVSQPFCGDCSRARLSADGSLYLCLFAASGISLRAQMRRGDSDTQIEDTISRIWRGRDDRYSELRSASPSGVSRSKVEMSVVGG